MKKLIATIALSASMVAGIVGCGTSNSTASNTNTASTGNTTTTITNSSGPRIALITINRQALFFNQLISGAQAEAKQLGANLTVYDPNNSPEAQNNAIDDYVQQGVKAIIVDAIDVHGILPALRTAAAAHIPVIAVDATVNDPSVSVQVGVDNQKGGVDIGNYFDNYVKTHMNGAATVGIVGALNSFIQLQRQKGFTDELKKVPGIKVVQVVDGKNVQEQAQTAAEDLLTANPNLQTIYATGEPALIGAIAAVKSAHKENNTAVFGWDLSKQALQAVQAGWVKAVVQQDPTTEGKDSVEAAMNLIQGKSEPKSIIVPLTIVTKQNANQFTNKFY